MHFFSTSSLFYLSCLTTRTYAACDSCTDNQWCAGADEDSGETFCKDYAAAGEACGFYTTPENEENCDGRIHKCYQPEDCTIPDLGGTCERLDLQHDVGDCCNEDRDCASGMCASGTNPDFVWASFCRVFDPAQDCRVGQERHVHGISTGGFVGLECLSTTVLDAVDSVCDNTQIIDVEQRVTCPENEHCFMCGERGVGTAVCSTDATIEEGCIAVLNAEIESEETEGSEENCNQGLLRKINKLVYMTVP